MELHLERKLASDEIQAGFVCGYCMALESDGRLDDTGRALRDRANKVLMPDMTGLVMSLIPEKEKEWVEWANNNTKDAYSACCVKAVMLVSAGLDKGMTPEEAANETDKLGLTGNQMSGVVHAVSYYHPRGDEFRRWWNLRVGGKQGTEANKKGTTLNPAVITVKER